MQSFMFRPHDTQRRRKFQESNCSWKASKRSYTNEIDRPSKRRRRLTPNFHIESYQSNSSVSSESTKYLLYSKYTAAIQIEKKNNISVSSEINPVGKYYPINSENVQECMIN